VDVQYLKYFIDICKSAPSIQHFSLLSAVGGNSKSIIKYSKFKGEAENYIKDAQFKLGSGLFRPSLLVTDEERYGWSQSLIQSVFPKVSFLLPSIYHEIHVNDLAKSMLIHAERKYQSEQSSDDILHYQDFLRELENQ